MLVGIRIHTVYSKKNLGWLNKRASREKKSEHIVNRDKNWLHSEILGSTLAQVSCGLLFVVSAKNHARNFKREIKFEHKNAATKVFQKAYLLSKQWRDFTF